jgi:glycosyltransferase involved in cell wall biosynthesis
VSQAAADRYIRLGAVPRRKCSVILNGIDVHEFAPNGEGGARIRAELGVSAADEEAEFVWIAVGRLAPAKDYPNLLHAFAEVRSGRSDARLWIAGDAAVGQIAALQQLLSEFELGDSVRWLGLRRDMPAVLEAADGFVSGSAWEGMPLAVGEAMAMAKPVVATDVGGVRELLGDAGVIVAAKDSAALARAMIATMGKSREALAAHGRSARQRIIDHFSMDATMDRWLALYESLLATS